MAARTSKGDELLVRDYKQHYMRDSKQKQMPSRCLFLDTETNQKETDFEIYHTMKMCWVCYALRKPKIGYTKKEWKYFEDTKLLWEYIEILALQGPDLYIFGHNIFFDLQSSGFFKYFTSWGWVLDFTYLKGLTYILTLKKNKRRLKILSTTNFFNFGLKDIGKMVGLAKGEVDFQTSSNEELSEYCKRDVEILVEAMSQYFSFLEANNLGNFGLTKSSQAMIAYRHRFMRQKIGIHEEEDVIALERRAYTGGRVEAFRLGKVEGSPFISLDINSMYPYVMRQNPCPIRLVGVVENAELQHTYELLSAFCIIADVRLKTDQPIYPKRHKNKLIFPVGVFHTTLCTAALKEALIRNHVLSIQKLAIYEKSNIFREYVDFFYNLKLKYGEEKNYVYRTMTKFFLNSLYGKFGQKQPIITTKRDITYDGYYRKETINLQTGETEVVTKLLNMLIIQYGEKSAKNSMVAIAAHITEYSRMLLWSIMEGIGVDKVLYVDTDSVKIRKEHLTDVKHEIDNEKLGALKPEYEFSNFTIYGCKDYEMDQEKVLKGVPKSADLLNEQQYHYKMWTNQATHLRREVMDYYIVKKMKKTLKREYDKGKVEKSGKVKPFVLYED